MVLSLMVYCIAMIFTIRDNYYVMIPARMGWYEERNFTLPLVGNFQHGDQDDDGEGYPPPEHPTKNTPEDNSEIDTTVPTFTWYAADGTDRYTFKITGDDYNAVIGPLDTTSYVLNDPLEQGEEYQWTILGGNSNGWCQDNPEWWSFTVSEDATENHDPNPPVCVQPADDADDVSISTNLEWSCSDPDGDDLTYDVYLGTDSTPDEGEKVANDITGTTFNPTYDLEYDTDYYWMIVAYDGNGGDTEDTSEVWHFTTEEDGGGGTPPDAPTLIAPPDEATDVSLQPTFGWSAVKGSRVASHGLTPTSSTFTRLSPADDYHIQVDDDSDFSSPEIDEDGISNTTYTDGSELQGCTTYYWRVRARNSNGYGSWSYRWWFETGSSW